MQGNSFLMPEGALRVKKATMFLVVCLFVRVFGSFVGPNARFVYYPVRVAVFVFLILVKKVLFC